MVGCGFNDWNFFIFVGLFDGWFFFWLRFFFPVLWPLMVLTMVGSKFAIDGGDGLGRI